MNNALRALYQLIGMLAGGIILAVVLIAVVSQVQPDIGAHVDSYLVNIKAEIGQQ